MNAAQEIGQLKTQLLNCQLAAEGRDCRAAEGDFGWSPALATVRESDIQRCMWHRMYDNMVDKLDRAKAELKAATQLLTAVEMAADD